MRHDWFWALALPNILAAVTQSIIKFMEDHAVIHHYYNYPKYLDLSHDVTYRTDIMPCIRINKPLVRPPDKNVYLKTIFFISHPKHMLMVLKRTVSMRRFF